MAHILVDGLNGRDDVCPKPDRIVVALVEGEPGEGALCTPEPLCDQRCLAKAGWGRDEDQLAARTDTCAQSRDQTRA